MQLLYACKARLVAAFLRRTTNERHDPSDRHDGEQGADCVHASLDPTPNSPLPNLPTPKFHGVAPSCMALPIHGRPATLSKNKRSADEMHVLRSNDAPSTCGFGGKALAPERRRRKIRKKSLFCLRYHHQRTSKLSFQSVSVMSGSSAGTSSPAGTM